METPSRKCDDGRDCDLCCRSERPVGSSERKLCGGLGTDGSQSGPRGEASHQGLVADFQTAEGRGTARDGLKQKLAGLKPAEITAKCIETLGQAGAVVDAKAPDDAAAFKAWLHQISQHVAEASREGGLFGAGSGPVSDKEKATLQQISTALKLAA